MPGAPSNPSAMAPKRPGSTRAAPPMKPASWPAHPRMRVYSLFGLTGFVYLLAGFVALRVVFALGAGEPKYEQVMGELANPLFVAFHVLCLVSVVFVLVRFFRLFPKAQPARIGPLKPPPPGLLRAGLYAIWAGVTIAFVAVLAGEIF